MMKRTKHTPGPWEVCESLDGTLQPYQKSTGRPLLTDSTPLPQREYNAALIAQAPNLLQLPKEAATFVDPILEGHKCLLMEIEATIWEAEHPE